jgi:penicillin-binding protein 1A
MAGKGKQRIEPSFEGERGRDEFRVDAADRVAGSSGRGKGKSGGNSGGNGGGGQSRGRREKVAPRRRSGGLFGLLRKLVYWCIVLGIWGGIALAGIVLYYGSRMPAASSWTIPDRPPNVKITSVEGTVIANRGATGGEALPLEDMSPFIPQAVMAIEDRRFYSHFGVDPLGLARAFVNNLTGQSIQGGSTITQQLAKNLFLSPDRTIERKVQEVLLSFWLEHKFSKDQILAMYLNRVFFGSNAYGVEAASRRYFNKSARDVNLGEAATLAGLLKAPTRLSPARDPQAAEARAQVVLGAMREEGYITDAESTTAMSQAPTRARSFWSGAQYYAADMVMDEVKSLVGNVSEDLVVDTTLDLGLEKKADEALTKLLDGEGKKLDASQAALVSIDGTGAIRAVVGGHDYAGSQFNRAVKARRQPGSAFKPFVYAAALEAGDKPSSLRNDAPIKIGNWMPENYEHKYNGEVTLTTALAHSLNTIAAQLVVEVGPDTVIKLARRLGIESELQSNASIALGTSEVSLLELTSAYAPFMNGGFKATPHIVSRITNSAGKVLYQASYDAPPRVLSESIVKDMDAMMMRVMTEGTGRSAQLKGWQTAGKSGTTQSFRDALFVGFTSNLTTGVWFGNDDGKSMKKVTGGGLPAKAWKDFMTAAHKGLTPAPLFGGGAFTDSPIPAPAETADPGIISDVISKVLSGGQDSYPQPPAAPEQTSSRQQLQPPATPGRPVPAWDGEGNDTPVPPGDIGRNPQPSAPPKRTTLLDIIMGN